MDELKCSKCNNYLSYFPISITKTGLNICGRCEVPKNQEDEVVPHTRNVVYEILAKEVAFPCRFVGEGCSEKLLGKNIARHEDHCSFRTVTCPASFLDLSHTKVALPQISSHCKEAHPHILVEEGFEIDVSESKSFRHIVITDHACFILKLQYDLQNKKLSCGMRSPDFNGKLGFDHFKLILEDDDTNVTKRLFIKDAEESTDVCLNVFDSLDSQGVIKAKLLCEEEKRSWVPVPEEVRKLFQCAFCNTIVRPPIIMFLQDDEVFCGTCIMTNKDYAAIEGKNFDKVAELLLYYCQNNSKGCKYKSHPSLLKQHEFRCSFRTAFCPLDCNWNGTIDEMTSHVTEYHPGDITSSLVFKERIQDGRKYVDFTKLYIIPFMGQFFRLYFSGKNKSYYWSVQKIGCFQEGFKYDIEIFDKVERKLSSTKLCTPLKKAKFLDKKDFCSFTLNQFQELLSSSNLTFRVRIFK